MSIQHRRLQAQVDRKNARIAQLETELAEARANYTAVCLKLAAATGRDLPELDGTDAAHPAWWRGNDYGVAQICRAVNDILDGKELSGVCGEPWESTRRRVAEARKDGELLDALEALVENSKRGGLLLHHQVGGHVKWSGSGLGLSHRSLRKAISQARGTK